MDNKPLEEQAEYLVKQKLLRYKFNVIKPSFDEHGADLLIMDNIKAQYSKNLKIQSKGRSLSGNNSIAIPVSYVVDDFIVFLYTIDNEDNEFLFIFFEEEIKKWNVNKKNEYTLSLTSNNVKNENFQKKIFSEHYANEIKSRLYKSKIKKYTSVIVDGIFLENAITKLLKIYKEIHPDKKLLRPSINEVIKNIILMYDKYDTHEKIINCNVFTYQNPSLVSKINANNTIQLDKNKECRIYPHDTNDFVCFEVIGHLERIVNTENIIFIADDMAYTPILNDLLQKGIDIILVMYSENDGGNMFTNHKWGMIDYPIAVSLGLKRIDW